MKEAEIISQLESLKENSQSFLEKDEPGSVWADDIKALDEAMDIIHDYALVTEQAARLMQKYETPKDVIRRGNGMFDAWQCPDCQGFIQHGNEHCHWCGRKIGWGLKPQKTKKRKR